MVNVDEKSNAQSWELEVTCKNKKYLDAVVSAVLKYGMIDFEVNLIDGIASHDDIFDGRYTVLMWCSWFNNLKRISKDLAKIEKALDD
jgi:hypothetical protein